MKGRTLHVVTCEKSCLKLGNARMKIFYVLGGTLGRIVRSLLLYHVGEIHYDITLLKEKWLVPIVTCERDMLS